MLCRVFEAPRARAVWAAANGAFRMVAAAAEDALAAVDLLHVTDAKESPSDLFAAPDREYIRQTLPALSEIYFRADVSGLDRIPEQGHVLFVGNHSGGTMIADTFVFAQALYDHFGPDRRFHQLAHDLVFFGVPIVPVVALGGLETGLFLGRGRRVASALSLNRLARLKVLPPVLGLPFGITVFDFPTASPYPQRSRSE